MNADDVEEPFLQPLPEVTGRPTEVYVPSSENITNLEGLLQQLTAGAAGEGHSRVELGTEEAAELLRYLKDSKSRVTEVEQQYAEYAAAQGADDCRSVASDDTANNQLATALTDLVSMMHQDRVKGDRKRNNDSLTRAIRELNCDRLGATEHGQMFSWETCAEKGEA